jgi:hypothetical protein
MIFILDFHSSLPPSSFNSLSMKSGKIVLQQGPFNVITLGQAISDYNN